MGKETVKERVYMKGIVSDSLRMECLLSVPDGEAIRVVLAIGRDGIFYASTLKALRKKIGKLYAVVHLKLKAVLDPGQTSPEDQRGLRHFH